MYSLVSFDSNIVRLALNVSLNGPMIYFNVPVVVLEGPTECNTFCVEIFNGEISIFSVNSTITGVHMTKLQLN